MSHGEGENHANSMKRTLGRRFSRRRRTPESPITSADWFADHCLRLEPAWFSSVQRTRVPDWESWIQSDGKLIWVNPAVERLTGFSVTDCFQMSEYPIELVDAPDKEQIRQILLGAVTGSSGNDVEFRVMTKTGNVMWFAVSWQPLMDPDGKASSFRMSMRDIADRKRMEQGLHKAMIRLGISADQFRT